MILLPPFQTQIIMKLNRMQSPDLAPVHTLPFPTRFPSIRAKFAEKLVRVDHSPTSLAALRKREENIAATKITEFLRKAVAAQSYGLMFANGSRFAEIGDALQKRDKYNFQSLSHLEKLSKINIEAVSKRLDKLSPGELDLKQKIMSRKLVFRHQSNANVDEGGILKIFSNHNLTQKNLATKNSIQMLHRDFEALSNHDFVFFGVEFSGKGTKTPPLNHLYGFCDFGANAFLVDEDHPGFKNSYLTLTAHCVTQPPRVGMNGHSEFMCQFPLASDEILRPRIRRYHEDNAPLFSFKDMKKAMALHLIEFSRNSQDEKFRNFVTSQAILEDACLDRILNSVFQPEFHLPRLLATKEYARHELRPMTIEEAVNAGNIKNLECIVHNL